MIRSRSWEISAWKMSAHDLGRTAAKGLEDNCEPVDVVGRAGSG